MPFALVTPDDPLTGRPRPPKTSWRIDFRDNPDFAWAWGTRFLVQLGNALGTLYLLYFLTDRVKLADPDDRPADHDPAVHGWAWSRPR